MKSKILKDIIKSFKSQPYRLAESSFTATLITDMRNESDAVFVWLEKFTSRFSHDDDELRATDIAVLKLFLKLRWRTIAGSSIDYTQHPNLPANQACLQIAQAITASHESICQV